MFVDPSWSVPAGRLRIDPPCTAIEAIDWSRSVLAFVLIAQSTEDDDRFGVVVCCVEIGRREYLGRITIDPERPIPFMDDYIVVDTKVGVIKILMFSADMHGTTIWQQSERHPEAMETPRGKGCARDGELIASGPS